MAGRPNKRPSKEALAIPIKIARISGKPVVVTSPSLPAACGIRSSAVSYTHLTLPTNREV